MRGAFGGGAGGAGCLILRADQRLFSGALFGFGGAQGLARIAATSAAAEYSAKRGAAPGGIDFTFQHGEAVALGQPLRREPTAHPRWR